MGNRRGLALGLVVLCVVPAGCAFQRNGLNVPAAPSGSGARQATAEFGSVTLIPPRLQLRESRFGSSVAMSAEGSTVIVGGPNDNPGRSPQPAFGAAWIYTSSATGWQPGPKLTPGRDRGDFGSAVGISGDGRVAVVGAPRYNGDKGAIWLYVGSGGGTWVGQKATVGNISGAGKFGSSLALSSDGTTILVGGPADNGGIGAVWVFHRVGQRLQLVTKLKPTGKYLTGSSFGASVALTPDGRVALVGGPGYSAGVGRVWPYANFGLGWRAQDGSNLTGAKGDGYGADVALSTDGATALIGAPKDGYVILSRRSGETWSRGSALYRVPEYAEPPNRFVGEGRHVAMTPDASRFFTTVTARGDRSVGYVFAYRSAGDRAPQVIPAGFGADVATSTDGQVLVVGAPTAGGGRGAAYSYTEGPSVSGVAPDVGPVAGGTPVTITGTNFVRVRAVMFGSAPAASFTVTSPTSISAVSPPGTGTVDVTVVTDRGTTAKARFGYAAPPVVKAIAPASGPAGGGTAVTISGENLVGTNAVRFGTSAATSFAVRTATQIDAVAPPSQGVVSVTVSSPWGMSAVTDAARFTYVAAPTENVISFDELSTGGPGSTPGALLTVNTQYSGRGVTFDAVKAVDYAKGPGAIPGFARSGTIGIEQCVGIEFCMSPIRASFSPPQRLVRLWVGFSGRLDKPIQVRLAAYNGATAVAAVYATLPANSSPTPIRTPLEVQLDSATITRIEVSVPGGYTNGVAVDHLVYSTG